MAEKWLSIVEYARAYSISDMTVRRRIKNGKLNAVLKDGKYFIPVDSMLGSAAEISESKPVEPARKKNPYSNSDRHIHHTATSQHAPEMDMLSSNPISYRESMPTPSVRKKDLAQPMNNQR